MHQHGNIIWRTNAIDENNTAKRNGTRTFLRMRVDYLVFVITGVSCTQVRACCERPSL